MRSVVKQKGVVLVGVLWLVIILTVIISTTSRSSRIDTKVTMSRVEEVRCKWAGRAGVEKTFALFNEDDTEADSLMDIWSNNPEDMNDVMLDSCRFTIRVVDESGKLNVNTATRDQLLMLPYMTDDIADAIIDWRDSDDIPGDFGAEAGYYETLRYPYTPRDGDFRTIRELLLVKDVTEELLYGEDTNFNGQLDYNERDGNISPPYDDGDEELDLGWIAYLTCYTGGGSSQQGGGETSIIQGGSENTGATGSSTNNNANSSGTSGNSSTNNNSSNNSNNLPSNNSSDNRNSGPTGGTSNNNNSNNTGTTPTGQDGNSSDQSTEQGDTDGGPVNVNTAPEYVLMALLGAEGVTYEDAEVAARSIVNYRDEITEGLSDASELVDGGAIEQDTFDRISSKLTTTSDVFTIYCISIAQRGLVDGARMLTEAVVDRSQSPAQILYWYQGTGY